MTLSFQIITLAALYLVFALSGQLLYKKSAAKIITDYGVSGFLHSFFFNSQLWVATALYIGAMVLWVLLLKTVPLNRVFPVMSALMLISLPLLTYYFLDEPLSLRYWLGVILIFTGITLIATDMPAS